jgi:hypothetical protein
MKQKQIPHPPGTFAACADCRREPTHWEVQGRTSREPVTFAPVPTRHLLECRPPCKRRTMLHLSLPAAIGEWGQLGETLPLPLPSPVVSNVRSIRSRAKGRAHA